MSNEEASFPPVYTHSVKISDTQKGIRIDVHVWATDKETAVREAFDTYVAAQKEAFLGGITLAPIELKENAKSCR